MDQALIDELKKNFKGDIATDEETLATHSHDASIYEVKPQLVVYPKDAEDVQNLIKFVNAHKKDVPNLSLTGRAAGTDMGGGSINDSIVINFQKYFNHIIGVKDGVGTAEPGVFYRDFEAETMKQNLQFPSYPASRELCAIGGIVNNNSGGEKSLEYGKTEKWVKRVKVVLSDGNTYELKPLNEQELKAKMDQKDFEGDLYRKMYDLITKNYEVLQKAKPTVSKNSAGYFLWNVWDPEKKIFDLTQLWVGAQGTLGMMLEADLGLVQVKQHSEMMIIFLHDFDHLGEIINQALALKPNSFETYDDNTLKLALKYFPEFAKKLGTSTFISTGFQFLPEFFMMLKGGFHLPKLILQVDFTGDDPAELEERIKQLKEKLAPLHPMTRIAHEKEEKKYWLIRRESFSLLRQKVRDKHTAPFIDDFAVLPEYLPEFLPKLRAIFAKYPTLIYTVAGHVGDGNFHIIPLMKIEEESQRAIIPKLGQEVYDLVLQYKGSTITAEHNDGLVRTPYLKQMYGEEVIKLFEETKKIFDPQNIFNPRKKVFGDMEYGMQHIRTHW